jgi:hypothetical protein
MEIPMTKTLKEKPTALPTRGVLYVRTLDKCNTSSGTFLGIKCQPFTFSHQICTLYTMLKDVSGMWKGHTFLHAYVWEEVT